MMMEYIDLMNELLDMEEKFDAIMDEDLNDAEMLYYTQVLNRCSGKLLNAAGSLHG